MGTRRLIISAKVLVLACVALVAMQAQRPGAAGAPGGGHDASQAARSRWRRPARRRSRRRAHGRPGNSDDRRLGRGSVARRFARLGLDDQVVRRRAATSVRSTTRRRRCCSASKQVTSYTISTFDPEFYCEVRKHYGFVWFEMQHSTMSWDNVAKMIAACPGPDGAAPMIRMPDQLESSIQKATDLGAIGLIFPTIRDGNQALEAARYSRFPPFGRRSSGSGQAGTDLGRRAGRLPEHLQRQHARRRDARDARRHHQRGRDCEHVWHRRGHPGQQRSVALLRDGRRPTRATSRC